MKRDVISDSKGFSLIELIVVVLIISILATGAVMSLAVVYDSDVERAARNLYTILDQARTDAIAYNDESQSQKVEVLAYIEQHDNGDYYAGVKKITTQKSGGVDPVVEILEEKKLANYRVTIFFGKKNSTIASADLVELQNGTDAIETGKPGLVEYSFKKGTGRLDPDKATSEYCDIFIDGSETFKVLLSTASGKCMINHE